MAVAAFISAPENSTLYNNVEYWVSPTGDDTAAGTALFPWRTYARAAAEAMKYSRFATGASMIIHMGGASLTAYSTVLTHGVAFDYGAFLVFVGDTTNTILGSTAMTAGTQVDVATGAGCTEAQITVAGAGWSVNAYRGKTLRVLTGSSAGVRATIASNTATVIRLCDNLFVITTGGLTLSAGDTFTIEEPGIELTTNEKSLFADMPADSGLGGVLLVNLRIEGTASNTRGVVQYLGCVSNGTRSVSGFNARTSSGFASQSTTAQIPNTIYSTLGMPTVVGDSYHWYAWGGIGNADDRSFTGGQWSANGAVQFGIYPSTRGSASVSGCLLTGPSLAQGIGASLDLSGGGAQVRVESNAEGAYGGCIQVAQQAKLRINRAAFACAGRCIVVAQNSQALLGTGGSVLITGAPTTNRAALLLSGNENTVLFRVAMAITGNGVGYDWEMGGLSGVAADILFAYYGVDVAAPSGDRIGRLGV